MAAPVVPPPCFAFLGCEMVAISEGTATIRFRPTEAMSNPYGMVQGGILAGVVDNVVGPAAFAAVGGKRFVTVQMSLTYVRGVSLFDVVLAHAEVVHVGRTQVLVEARMERESDGVLLYKATVTNVIIDR